jgi:hypothetical protein
MLVLAWRNLERLRKLPHILLVSLHKNSVSSSTGVLTKLARPRFRVVVHYMRLLFESPIFFDEWILKV